MSQTLLQELDNADTLIAALRSQLSRGSSASDMLRYLILEQGIEQQILLMAVFAAAFNCPLGAVTAIGGWWHEDSLELSDADINAYLAPVLEDFLTSQG